MSFCDYSSRLRLRTAPSLRHIHEQPGPLAEAPRGVQPGFTGMVEADPIPVRVTEVSFAPEPGLVDRTVVNLYSLAQEPLDLGIDIFALEIDDDASA